MLKIPYLYLPSLLLFFAQSTFLSATGIWWLGGTGDWDDPTKWSGGEVPGIGDSVWLGYADDGEVATGAQSINLTGDVIIHDLHIFGEGDRAVTLNGGKLMFGAGNGDDAIIVDASGSQPTTINSDLALNRRSNVNIGNSADFRINGDLQPTPEKIPDTDDDFPGWNSGGWSWNPSGAGDANVIFSGSGSQSIAQLENDASSLKFIVENPDASFGRLVARNGSFSMEFAESVSVSGIAPNANRTIELKRGGTQDIVVGASGADLLGGSSGLLEIIEGSAGQGHFTLLAGRLGNGDSGSANGIGAGAPVVLSADSTIEFGTTGQAARRGIFADNNERISGEGNLRLNMTDASDIFTVFGVLTYTGRTMLDVGTFQLRVAGDGTESWQIGQLPQATIAEIGNSATLDLNGVNQQLGGISDLNDTAGQVLLGGATLTIHSDVDSSFSGAISGTGEIIKRGEATFTVDGNYTNPAGRGLTVENGLFAVTGDMSVVDGTFSLTGGRVSANSLDASDITWEVIIAATAANLNMVAVTTADITDSTLSIALGQDYSPEFGTEFTLLYASDSITGANAANMFGYSDGQILSIDGIDFVINWVEGSEAIVLTAIPEPSQVAVLVALVALLCALRRRRGH